MAWDREESELAPVAPALPKSYLIVALITNVDRLDTDLYFEHYVRD